VAALALNGRTQRVFSLRTGEMKVRNVFTTRRHLHAKKHHQADDEPVSLRGVSSWLLYQM